MAFPGKLRKIGHLGLWSKDPLKLAQWYHEVLGFRLVDTMEYDHFGGKGTAVFMGIGQDHHDLVLFPCPEEARAELFDRFNRVNHFAYEVGSLEDLFRMKRYFRERGVEIVRGVGRLYPGSNYNLDIRDPEGNRIEFYYDIEQIGWQGTPKPRGMWRPYKEFDDLESLLAWDREAEES